MPRINHLAVAIATISAFLMSSLYYSPLIAGDFWRAVDPVTVAAIKPSLSKAAIEIARTLVITYLLARLVNRCAADWKAAIELGLWLWFGFSAMMWTGAVMWERTPWQIALIHSGDWLFKTFLIMAILGFWQQRRQRKRGLRNAKEQFILAATAQNVKRLIRYLSQSKHPTIGLT